MFSDIVVVIDVAHCFVQQVLFTVNIQGSKAVEFVIIGAMRAFQMSIFLRVSLPILDQPTAKASDQFAQFFDFEP